MNLRRSRVVLSLFALVIAGSVATVFAVDGVILIDQNRALAGNVTPGDAPGFPVSITQPGSYRLSGNLTVPADVSGIAIQAAHVTLDLNGFRIAGDGTGGLFGVVTGTNFANLSFPGIAVRNGTITRFSTGVFLPAFAPNDSSEVTQIRASDNFLIGISVGRNSTVSGNTATGNNLGIRAGEHSTVTGNTSSGNQETGIAVDCPSSVVGNTAAGNPEAFDIVFGAGCTFANNTPATP
jgi:hypothetical protein